MELQELPKKLAETAIEHQFQEKQITFSVRLSEKPIETTLNNKEGQEPQPIKWSNLQLPTIKEYQQLMFHLEKMEKEDYLSKQIKNTKAICELQKRLNTIIELKQKEPSRLQLQNDLATLKQRVKTLAEGLESLEDNFDEQIETNKEKFEELEDKINLSQHLKKTKSNSSLQPSFPIDIQSGINQLGFLDLQSDDDEKHEYSGDEKPLTSTEKLEQLAAKLEMFESFLKQSLNAEESAKALQSATIVGIQLDVAELTDAIEALKTNKPNTKNNTNDTLAMLENTLASPETTITNKSYLEVKQALSQFQTELAGQNKLLVEHMSSNIKNNSRTEERTAEQDKLLQALKESLETLKDQLAAIEKENKPTIPNTAQSNKNTEDGSIETDLKELKEQVLEQAKSLQEVRNSTYFSTKLSQQAQEISTLKKWLMFFGSGYTIALAALLWHYTHK